MIIRVDSIYNRDGHLYIKKENEDCFLHLESDTSGVVRKKWWWDPITPELYEVLLKHQIADLKERVFPHASQALNLDQLQKTIGLELFEKVLRLIYSSRTLCIRHLPHKNVWAVLSPSEQDFPLSTFESEAAAETFCLSLGKDSRRGEI